VRQLGKVRRAGFVPLLAVAALAVAVGAPSLAARVLAAPVNTERPTLAVVPVVGATVTPSRGSWTDNPSSFTYQLLRCPASGGQPDGTGCTASTAQLPDPFALTVEQADVGTRFRVRVTATNAEGSASAVSDPTLEAASPPPQNVTGCPPVQGVGNLRPDEISPPARLEIDRQTVTPAVITRTTQRITVRVLILACDGRSVQGALVYATPVPFQQFTPVERATDAQGWATLTMTRQRFFPATPRQQNLVVFVRARHPGEDSLGGISSRRLVSFRVRL
jgi:hypothetical protein